ncbi:MAG: hypothetical protein KF830_06755 [Planctomycetes bacterium]|nr:hypothetical protein [Planctomycetota bacterium]
MAAIVVPQPECSAKGGSTTRDNGGSTPTTLTCGDVTIDTSAGTLKASGACVEAGNDATGPCTITEMWVGTFVDAGDPPNGTLDCSELRNPQKQEGGSTTPRICVNSYSARIGPGAGGGTTGGGAMVVCAKVKCPGDDAPKQLNAVAWVGSVKVPPGKDICSCFEWNGVDVIVQPGEASPLDDADDAPPPSAIDGDWFNEPTGSTFDRGASFHIRSATSGALLQSCTVRTEANYALFEISSHVASAAAVAVAVVHSDGAVVHTEVVPLTAAANGRPTGVWASTSSLEGMEMVVRLYSTDMVELGAYTVDM